MICEDIVRIFWLLNGTGKKPCKKPMTCDKLTGTCVTPAPPPPQPCTAPIGASFTHMVPADSGR